MSLADMSAVSHPDQLAEGGRSAPYSGRCSVGSCSPSPARWPRSPRWLGAACFACAATRWRTWKAGWPSPGAGCSSAAPRTVCGGVCGCALPTGAGGPGRLGRSAARGRRARAAPTTRPAAASGPDRSPGARTLKARSRAAPFAGQRQPRWPRLLSMQRGAAGRSKVRMTTARNHRPRVLLSSEAPVGAAVPRVALLPQSGNRNIPVLFRDGSLPLVKTVPRSYYLVRGPYYSSRSGQHDDEHRVSVGEGIAALQRATRGAVRRSWIS